MTWVIVLREGQIFVCLKLQVPGEEEPKQERRQTGPISGTKIQTGKQEESLAQKRAQVGSWLPSEAGLSPGIWLS